MTLQDTNELREKIKVLVLDGVLEADVTRGRDKPFKIEYPISVVDDIMSLIKADRERLLDAVIEVLTTGNAGDVIPVTREQDNFGVGYAHAKRDLLAILTASKSSVKETNPLYCDSCKRPHGLLVDCQDVKEPS